MNVNVYVQPQHFKDFNGYSVVVFGQTYFGIPKSHGVIHLDKIDHRMFPEIIAKPSLREIEDAITEKWVRSLDGKQPHLIRSSRGYSIVAYKGVFFGIPKMLGEVRLEEIDLDDVPSIIDKPSLNDLEDEIADRWARSMPDKNPRLVSDCGAFNIVFFNGMYFGIPKAWGDFRLEVGDAASKPGLIQDQTLQGAKAHARAREETPARSSVRALVVSILRRIKGES